MRTALRVLTLAALVVSLSSVSSAYYYWIYFAGRTGPFQRLPAKFDLNALPNKTVSYFISDKPPGKLVDGDSFEALVSQIRLAAEAWNGVATSDLRVRFGGITAIGNPQATPGIDVVFDDDMPPGVLAQSKPSTPADLGDLTKSPGFVPILRSRLQLRSDLTTKQQASYSDSFFFMTVVHEFGHTLGLQHSTASATMSTWNTRSTTKARPLAADDIAGISLLYPAPGFTAGTGSISGKVLANGNGMNLASVVALSTDGTAIAAMTNPDGAYRIDGLPPGEYYVYTQPLPPAQSGEAAPAAIVPPSDAQGSPFPANTGFTAQFFPKTRDWQQATRVAVKAAAEAADINFSVDPRSGPSIYDMLVYSYLGPSGKEVPAHPAPLVSGDRRWLAINAAGLFGGNPVHFAPGLSFNVVGDAATLESPTLAYWQSGYLLMVANANPVSKPTPVALAVATYDDLYVLPAAFSVVPTAGPTISSVSGSTDGFGNSTVTLAGDNLTANTRILFDGADALSSKKNDDGTLTVAAPPATGSHNAAVEALAGDGQTSSQLLGSAAPLTFTYAAPQRPSIAVTPASVTAGTDTMIEITGVDTSFLDGQTVIGFGSSDISVRRTWILERGRVLLNISIGAAAAPGLVTVTALSGLQLVTLNAVLEVRPAVSSQISLRAPILNLATGLPGVPPGGTALISATGLPANLTGWTVTIAGSGTDFTIDSDYRIHATVPVGAPLGPALVRLIPPSGDPIPPLLLQVDAAPPIIQSAAGPTGQLIDSTHPVSRGDVITLDVTRLAGASAAVSAASVHISVGGVDHIASSVSPVLLTDLSKVQFSLASGLPDATQQAVTVRVGTRVSLPYTIYVTPAASALAQTAQRK